MNNLVRPWDLVATSYSESIASHLARYATDAFRLGEVARDARVLDVATGPGALARHAARTGERTVHAIDFSSAMIERLRALATPAELARITTRVGDGQALPYDDASFEVAFSMFGLFMFADRIKGFAELYRVLVPGGRALVTSWHAPKTVPVMVEFDAAIGAVFPSLARNPSQAAPLSHAETFAHEMARPGFEVEVRQLSHTLEVPSFEALWELLVKQRAGLALVAADTPPETFAPLLARAKASLLSTLGPGARDVVMPAWLAIGRKP